MPLDVFDVAPCFRSLLLSSPLLLLLPLLRLSAGRSFLDGLIASAAAEEQAALAHSKREKKVKKSCSSKQCFTFDFSKIAFIDCRRKSKKGDDAICRLLRLPRSGPSADALCVRSGTDVMPSDEERSQLMPLNTPVLPRFLFLLLASFHHRAHRSRPRPRPSSSTPPHLKQQHLNNNSAASSPPSRRPRPPPLPQRQQQQQQQQQTLSPPLSPPSSPGPGAGAGCSLRRRPPPRLRRRRSCRRSRPCLLLLPLLRRRRASPPGSGSSA